MAILEEQKNVIMLIPIQMMDVIIVLKKIFGLARANLQCVLIHVKMDTDLGQKSVTMEIITTTMDAVNYALKRITGVAQAILEMLLSAQQLVEMDIFEVPRNVTN